MTRVSNLARSEIIDKARDELVQTEEKYKRLAGFDREELNNRASWGVPASTAKA